MGRVGNMKNNAAATNEAMPKIIKRENQSSGNSGSSRNLIKHQILSAEEEGRSILETAREEAEELLKSAELRSVEIKNDAFKAGCEEAEGEYLEKLLAIKEEREKVLSTVEQDVLRLSVKIAEKIIGDEVKADEKVRGEMILNALSGVRQKENLTVRVNSKDLPLIADLRERLKISHPDQFIDFVADPAVSNGGCVVESVSGKIDARLETQLRVLETALLARVSSDS